MGVILKFKDHWSVGLKGFTTVCEDKEFENVHCKIEEVLQEKTNENFFF